MLFLTTHSLHGRIVTIKVGPNKIAFQAHSSLLFAASTYFSAAFSTPWAGLSDFELSSFGGLSELDLPGFEADLFEIYVKFLYTGHLYTQRADDHTETAAYKYWDLEWDRLFDLHCMGSYLLDAGFQNAIMDALLDKWRQDQRFPVGYARLVYDKTTPGSAVRRLIVDFHIHLRKGALILDKASCEEPDAPAEFFHDALIELAAVQSGKGPSIPFERFLPCVRYHDHDSVGLSERCSAGKKDVVVS